MTLKAGERVIILTGGAGGINADYWDYTNNRGCVVPGGFNGGGECFASGGGCGCTDIYYRGMRVAAAAGSGGGNYDQRGQMGRTSANKDKIAETKRGGGSDKLDAGGSGGGWFGGAVCKVDYGGYGGVNGWDSSIFTLEQEFEGCAYTRTGSRDGSALVEYLGE